MKTVVSSSSRKPMISKLILSIWVIFCLSLFMFLPGSVSYIHWTRIGEWQLLLEKLVRINFLNALGTLLISASGTLLFCIVCMSLGSFIAKMGRLNRLSTMPTTTSDVAFAATEFLIGHGILSILFLALSGIYQLPPLVTSLILLASFLLGAREMKDRIGLLFPKAKSFFRENLLGGSSKGFAVIIIGIFFASLLYSSARISYDSTSIYFSNAKLTAMTQHIQYFLDDVFVISAFQTAIQFTVLIQIFGDQSARLLSWAFGTVIIIFSLAIGEEVHISKKARGILLILTLTSTAFMDLMGDGKVDLMSSAPAIAAIYWMVIESKSHGSKKHLLLTGFLCGLAIVGRPFNAFLLGVLVCLFILQRTIIARSDTYRKSFLSSLTTLTWIAIGASGLGLYHILANWLILGSPLAFVSSITSINLSSGPWDFNPQRIMLIRLFYPFSATFLNTPQSLGNMSPLVLAFLPSLFFKDIRKKIEIPKSMLSLVTVAFITLYLWVFFFFSVLEFRYVLFLWIILFIPVAEIISAVLAVEDRFFQILLSGAISIILIFSLGRIVYISLDTYSPIDLLGNPQCDTSRFCEYLRSINESAAPGDRVLTLSAFRYYLRNDLFVCSTKHDEYAVLQRLDNENMDEFWQEVYRKGYKYIAYENDYTTRHLQFKVIPSPENTPEWIKLEPIFGKLGELQIAYKINYINPPSMSKMQCQQNSSGVWEIYSMIP